MRKEQSCSNFKVTKIWTHAALYVPFARKYTRKMSGQPFAAQRSKVGVRWDVCVCSYACASAKQESCLLEYTQVHTALYIKILLTMHSRCSANCSGQRHTQLLNQIGLGGVLQSVMAWPLSHTLAQTRCTHLQKPCQKTTLFFFKVSNSLSHPLECASSPKKCASRF